MCTLTVELEIPINIESPPEQHIFRAGQLGLIFSKWLPISRDKGIAISEDDVELLLWFDLQSARVREEEVEKIVNLSVKYVRAEIIVRDIALDLADYMQRDSLNREESTEIDKDLQTQYEKIGKTILQSLLNRINRLITYVRTVKGQYWLLKYPLNVEERLQHYFQEFEAKGKIDGGKAFEFRPRLDDVIYCLMSQADRSIVKSEWDNISQFVKSNNKRTPLVLELLTGAEQLAQNGYRRSALTEAFTALEVAVSEFGKSHKDKKGKLSSEFGSRLNIHTLDEQIEHLGFSATIRYLIPLLIPEDVLSTKILSDCHEAIIERNNVVHNGQRDVDTNKIYKFISSIKACCKILREYNSDENISTNV